jgi:sec-independent protein translocase protein TatB
MFDIGFWEFALLIVISLLLIKPEQIPKIANQIGKIFGKVKKITQQLKEEFDWQPEANTLKSHLKSLDKNTPIIEIFDKNKPL